jgi:hypothetical protein
MLWCLIGAVVILSVPTSTKYGFRFDTFACGDRFCAGSDGNERT